MKSYKYKTPAVVVNSGDSNGYGVIINLGREGIPVISVDSNPKNITFYSKYTKKAICPDYKTSEKKFIEFLLDLGRNCNDKPVLFITGDLQLLTVLKYEERIKEYYHLPTASKDIVEKLVNKITFYKILANYKISHAQSFFPETLAEVEGLSNKIEYPYIIKPVQSKVFLKEFGNKCLPVNSEDELINFYKKVSKVEEKIIIQKLITGTERYLVYTYFNKDSRPVAVCCYKKKRINPIDYGNACMCQIFWEPEAIEICINTLKKIKYRGLAEAEIQRDHSDGQLKLVEINARSTTEARLSAAYGLNMELFAYRDVLGLKNRPTSINKNGLKWVDFLRDFMSVFSPEGYLAAKRITFLQWVDSLRGKKEFAFLAKDDPLPFAILLLRFLKMYGLKKSNFYKLFNVIQSRIF